MDNLGDRGRLQILDVPPARRRPLAAFAQRIAVSGAVERRAASGENHTLDQPVRDRLAITALVE